jgi:hypothetical protein
MSISEPEEEELHPKHQADFYTASGRETLHDLWLINQFKHGTIEQHGGYSKREFRGFFEQWMRDLIKRGHLDIQRPLPTHAELGRLFNIHTDQVARVLRRLRKEHLLPAKQPRMNAGEPVWTPRDIYALEWIADMRAVRYDQLRRLLSRESEFATKDPQMLSMSRTTDVIKRWVQTGNALYKPILAKQPGWVWLTRKGLQAFSEVGYRASGKPGVGTLEHLYWINEVRLHLEELNTDNRDVWWTSERFLQHQHDQMKKKDQEEEHLVDGRVEIEEHGETTNEFEIEVELSRKNDTYLQKLMRGGYHGFSSRALRYYVGEEAETTVVSALNKVTGTIIHRPWIEVYSLSDFKRLKKVAQID